MGLLGHRRLGCPEMRLTCRAARDAIDGRLRAAPKRRARTMGAAVALLSRLAPRLRSLERLWLDAVEDYHFARRRGMIVPGDGGGSGSDSDSESEEGPSLRSFGALAGALEALPSPALLTRLALHKVDADALGDDKLGARALAAALARLTALRRLDLRLKMVSDHSGDPDGYKRQTARAARALAALRRLPALADLRLTLCIAVVDDGARRRPPEPLLYYQLPRGAQMLPWRTLERIDFFEDAAALLPVLLQPGVARQLTRLRALRCNLNSGGMDSSPQLFARPLGYLWDAPWLRQLTRFELLGLYTGCAHHHGVFQALMNAQFCRGMFPPRASDFGKELRQLVAILGAGAGGGAAAGAARADGNDLDAPFGAQPQEPLLARAEVVAIAGDVDPHDPDEEQRRLGLGGGGGACAVLRACNPGTLRRLALEGFSARDVRSEIAARAGEFTELERVDLGWDDGLWTYVGDDPGAGSRAEQLAALRLRPWRAGDGDESSSDDGGG